MSLDSDVSSAPIDQRTVVTRTTAGLVETRAVPREVMT